VDLPEIGHCRPAAEFLGIDAVERREDRRHRVVDPNIDRAQFLLDPVRRHLDRLGFGHIGDNRKSADVVTAYFCSRCFKPRGIARQDSDLAALSSELQCRSPPHPGARACDDNDH
jgi:hypothetical protein